MENKKIYGTSALEYVPTEESYDENTVFVDEPNNIEDLRSDLISDSSNKKVEEKISVDAISGIKSSSVYEKDDSDITDMINERNIKGKTITRSGKEIIKDLIKEYPTDEESESISKYFESENFKNNILLIDEIEHAFGEKITNKLKNITTSSEYERIYIRFVNQIYSTYNYVVQYNDDISQLNKLIKKIDDYSDKEKNSENQDVESAYASLQNAQGMLTELLSSISNLDERNRRLRQDYTIDDIDIRTIESVKDCLDEAMSFSWIYKKLDNICERLPRDLKDIKKVNSTIENWISDIREDPDTLYTFPVNDFLSLEESRIKFIEYIANSIMLHHNIQYLDKIPQDENDVQNYIVSNGYDSNENIKKYNDQAVLFLYVLTKSFKYKKIIDDHSRRVLSYTLDIISKMGIEQHRNTIVNLIEHIYNKVYGGIE